MTFFFIIILVTTLIIGVFWFKIKTPIMHIFYKHKFLVVAMVLLSSCRETELKRMPDTLPDIRGNITSLSGADKSEENATLFIAIKAIEGVDVKIAEATISVTEETLIEDSNGKKLSAAALKQGQEVEVWLEAEMMESLPVQANAIAVRIPDQE